MTPDFRFILLLATAAFGLVGCGQKEREITELERKEADHLAAEADFALTLRDYPRAEATMEKVVELVPDNGGYWLTLGSTRKRAGKAAGAKKAYEEALNLYAQQAKKNATDPEPWLEQIYTLALLGRIDDARSLSQRMSQEFPNHRTVRIFIEEKQLDQTLADPGFKDMAL